MKIPDYNKKIKHPTYLELQEEIKRLKEEYMILQNASDEVEEEKDREIERLNNIINKIKKGLDNFYKKHSRLSWTEEDYIEFIDCIDRELKGSDKE